MDDARRLLWIICVRIATSHWALPRDMTSSHRSRRGSRCERYPLGVTPSLTLPSPSQAPFEGTFGQFLLICPPPPPAARLSKHGLVQAPGGR